MDKTNTPDISDASTHPPTPNPNPDDLNPGGPGTDETTATTEVGPVSPHNELKMKL